MEQSSDVVSFQAAVIRILGHGLRIQIVGFLKARERSVSEIAEHFGLDAPVLSRHLAALKRAGILGTRKSGLKVYYHVAMKCVPEFLDEVARAIKGKFK